MKETHNLEYKEQITNSFLKTVSAFSNYDGGKIIFGIADDGTEKPLSDPVKNCLAIENAINDSITPQPDFSLAVNEEKGTVTLTVHEGVAKPYLYKSKAYKRNDTATIEVDSLEFTRLALKGKNLKYEDLPAENQNLTFSFLEKKFREIAGVEVFDDNILKTLSLRSQKDGFNNAAALLSDQNDFPGIDVAKFGENISIIKKRATFEHRSVLESYENALSFYKDFYEYEEIKGAVRSTVQTVPEAAFREAVANALIHRTWDVSSAIRILMFDDKIQVISPGGLPSGLTEAEYMQGKISVLRNPVLANVFYRLGIVEIFGTGVLRILETYRQSLVKPKFEITDNSISVELPVVQTELNLSADERTVYDALSKNIRKSISEITAAVPFGKSKTGEILNALAESGYVSVSGNGRGTKYALS
ncbi:MAG: putative DNA binding domain-containing protein [Treponema sp.]|uniref:ATP-binding protein n=1 Tax=Treponema sp. TaxID=166 RepID=UPI0025F26CCA|nr:ATP-binding protein [Treponema sp.]MBQ9283398.1 putative DNA binding domain-containing protein [Treponema sp.]